MTFWIELPAGPGECLSLPPAVAEGEMVRGAPEHHPFTNPRRQAIIFSAPPEMARHEGQYADDSGGWAQVPGPARMLTREEHSALVVSVRPDLAVPAAEGHDAHR
jgi:hypothetical protein